MARWNALRQRLADRSTVDHPPPSSPVPILAELAETARRLVERRPEAAVSLTVQTPAGALSAVVSWADGQASITVPTPETAAAASGGRPEPYGGEPGPSAGQPPGGEPSWDQRPGGATTGSAPAPPPHPIYGHPPGASPPPAETYPPADPHSPAAAQLAEILRQDPSLLTHRPAPDPRPPA